MLLFCVQLFNHGAVSDSELIWYAKRCSMDSDGAIDVQLLCGAGLHETKRYLSDKADNDAQAALAYVVECERAGDFDDWSPSETSETYDEYYSGS